LLSWTGRDGQEYWGIWRPHSKPFAQVVIAHASIARDCFLPLGLAWGDSNFVLAALIPCYFTLTDSLYLLFQRHAKPGIRIC
jgi:hypothetical protein